LQQNEHSTSCADCGTGPSISGASSAIGRRTFIAQSAIFAAVAALAACGAASDATAPALSGSTTVRLADQPALANVGGVALVTIASSPFALVRTGTSTFVALSRVCPHQGSIVNQSTTGFLCPNHGAQFSTTGTWVGGERTSSMRSYATIYDAAAGTITVG
jgi:cytochrome b6-f complex iron-sulfur subunit